MGFFSNDEVAAALPTTNLRGHSVEFLHKHQCQVCPLNDLLGNLSPHMKPSGSKQPLIYMLGAAPGKTDDEVDGHFRGSLGKILRMRIPSDWLPDIRFNNVVRTHTPKGREPTPVEMECCRPSVIGDIERSKPEAIFGFGPVPLEWAMPGESRPTLWAGRMTPIKVGNHACWFFPMLDLKFIRDGRKFEPRHKGDYGSDYEFAFHLHLKRAFAAVDKGLPEPRIVTPDEIEQGLSWASGKEGDLQRVKDFLKRARKEKYVGYDYETKGLNAQGKGAKILTVAIALAKESFGIALNHKGAKWSADERDEVHDLVEQFLRAPNCHKISHRLAFEAEWSAHYYGRKAVSSKWEDTETMAYVLDERKRGHNLDFLMRLYFGLRIKGLSKVDRKNLEKFDVETVLRYNCIDAKAHRMLFFAQRRALKADGMWRQYLQHRGRAISTALTKLKGVPIDQKQVAAFKTEYTKKVKAAEKEIFALPIVKKFEKQFGEAFNPGSNPHVKKLLKEVAGLKVEKVDEKTLAKLPHSIAKNILKWRKPVKLLSTYIEPVLPDSPHIFPDGMLHPVINTNRTATSRTSSEDPNIQNWPSRGPGKVIRRQVAPLRDDEVIVSFDYGSIQGRNVAMESLDRNLLKVYHEHYDTHADWLRRLVRDVPNWCDRKQLKADKKYFSEKRSKVKNGFVFPSFFGAMPTKVSNELGITERQAHKLQDEFFGEFPEVHEWQAEVREFYNKHGYVDGLGGFRRHAPVSYTELINSPIQGDEVALVCDAWDRLSAREIPEVQPNMMIHDDFTFVWKKKHVEKLSEIVLDEMLNIKFEWALVCPMEVEMSVGKNWCDKEGVGKFENDLKRGGWYEV